MHEELDLEISNEQERQTNTQKYRQDRLLGQVNYQERITNVPINNQESSQTQGNHIPQSAKINE